MSGHKRIIYVLNAFVYDAPNAVIVSIGKGMAAAGWDVLFVAWSRGGPLRDELSEMGFKTEVLGKSLIGGAMALRRLVYSFKPSIVHASLARPTLGVVLTRLVCGRCDVRWVASDHGIHEWHEKGKLQGAVIECFMPAALNTMDAVVTVSENAASDLHKKGLHPGLVCVIPNGVDVRRFYPRPKAMRRQFIKEMFSVSTDPDEVFLIGAAGNLRKLKGFDLLIPALGKVLDSYPGVRVVLWGDGPESGHLKQQAQDLLQDRAHAISFPGHEMEIEHYLPLLDLYVQPSRVESFGMAAAEAMACRTAVIVSDAGGLPFLVTHGESGLVFPVDDVDSLTECISFMISNKLRRLNMARGGRLRVLKEFTRQGMVSRAACLYKELLTEPGLSDDRI